MRILSTVLLLALAASGPGFALQIDSEEPVSETPSSLEVLQSNGRDLGDAVEQARRQCNGRIISAETRRNGNRETHVIKCLTKDGTVRTFRIPGKSSGRI